MRSKSSSQNGPSPMRLYVDYAQLLKTLCLERAVPIPVLADVAVVSQVFQDCAPHFQRIHRALRLEKNLAVHTDQRRERKPATPIGAERGDCIGRIRPFK